MGRILENWRVPAAGLFAVILIGGAYVLARGIGSPPAVEASTETALLKAIATKDSDNDGLPDWEESLYGTDPHNSDSFKLGLTDGEAVAKGLIVPKAIANIPNATSTQSANSGTLTETFAENFFMLYLSAKQANNGVDLTSDQTSTLAEQAVNQFLQTFVPASDFKTAEDIKISGTGPDALRVFAIAAEAVFRNSKDKDEEATMSDLEYFQSAIQGDDATAPAHLVSLAKTYRSSAAGLAVLPVPKELATDDLVLVNAIMRLGGIYSDFARVGTDPLGAMLALQQYQQTELAAEQAFIDLYKVYATSGVVIPNGTPGASFVNLMTNIGAQQKAATQTP